MVLEIGIAKHLVEFRRGYWQLKDVLGPFLIWKWRLGHLSTLMGVLARDGAPACATNSSEQDDFTEVILISPGGDL